MQINIDIKCEMEFDRYHGSFVVVSRLLMIVSDRFG